MNYTHYSLHFHVLKTENGCSCSLKCLLYWSLFQRISSAVQSLVRSPWLSFYWLWNCNFYIRFNDSSSRPHKKILVLLEENGNCLEVIAWTLLSIHLRAPWNGKLCSPWELAWSVVWRRGSRLSGLQAHAIMLDSVICKENKILLDFSCDMFWDWLWNALGLIEFYMHAEKSPRLWMSVLNGRAVQCSSHEFLGLLPDTAKTFYKAFARYIS